MKRMVAVLLTVALLLSMGACQKQPEKEPENPATSPTLTLQDELDQAPEATHYDWADDLPRMDGSTSTIPLEAGIRAALFGISQEEAELQVSHSTTYGSFYNLIDGKCDLIFSVPLSDSQIAEAREKGMELEMTAIAAEGFVFVVNAQNPVDTLTQQQLRDIYSGKITNWREVGGNDAPIVAYQRNETSGSQNFMHTFMGDTPLMDPLTSAIDAPSSMGELMDAIAVYDNAENAIGYSVYAYAADMYGNGNEIKFIHVDGVEPNKSTMAAGSYPLLSYNYAVYSKATSADSNLRKLVEWIGTDEGQRAVKAAGCIPLRDVGEVTETVISLYTAVGTGPEKPADYTPSLMQYKALSLIKDGRVQGLANTELQDEINAFIGESEAYTECVNGYLSVVCGEKTAIYDLVAGRRIAFSDLFFKGEDFVSTLNAALSKECKRQSWDIDLNGNSIFVDYYPIKREFAGIPAGHDTFTLSYVRFGEDNLYFSKGVSLPITGVYTKSVLSVPRDLSGVFDKNVRLEWQLVQDNVYATNNPLLWSGTNGQLLDESHYDPVISRKINDQLRTIYQNEFTKEYFSAYYGDEFTGAEGCEMNLSLLGGRWVLSRGGLFVPFAKEKHLPFLYDAFYLFDLTTGEEVPYTVLLKDGWEEAAAWYQVGEEICTGNDTSYYDRGIEGVVTVQQPDTDGWRFAKLTADDGVVKVMFERTQPEFGALWAEVPLEYIG